MPTSTSVPPEKGQREPLTAAERDDLALEVLLTCSILRETANTLERAALLLRPPRLAPSRPVYPQFRGRDE